MFHLPLESIPPEFDPYLVIYIFSTFQYNLNLRRPRDMEDSLTLFWELITWNNVVR
jgi:hypothetical protein